MQQSKQQILSNSVSQGEGDLGASLEHLRTVMGDNPAFAMTEPLPQGKSAFEVAQERGVRTEQQGFTDYLGAGWRQDSPVDGIAAWAAQRQIKPDPTYNPFEPKRFAELSAGIDPSFHPELLKAGSVEEAYFIRDRLLQKQKDLQVLGDLGVPGNIARMAAGFIEPTGLLLSLGSGGIAGVVRGGVTMRNAMKLREAARAAGDINLAMRAASMAEKAASMDSGLKAVGRGVGTAAVGGYAFERLRQGVNFEDSQGEALIAGLMSSAFAAPFIYAGSRSALRAKARAHEELRVFSDLKDILETGRQATPEEHARFAAVVARAEENAGFSAPRKSAEEAAAYQQRQDAILAEYDKAWEHAATPDRLALEVQRSNSAEAKARIERKLAAEREQSRAEVAKLVARALHEVPNDESPAMKAAFDKALAEHFVATEATVVGPKMDPMDEMKMLLKRAGAYDTPVEPAPVQDAATLTPREQPAAVNDTPAKASVVGQDTRFLNPRTMDVETGTIVGERADGKFFIEDGEGNRVTVSPHDIEEGHPGSAVGPADGFLPGSVGSAQIAEVPTALGDKSHMSPIRFDISAVLNRSPNSEIRGITQLLVKDAIGFSDFAAQSQTASEAKRLMQRVIGGRFHEEAGVAFTEAKKKLGIPFWQERQFADRFYQDVTRISSGDYATLNAPHNATIRGELERASAAQRRVYDTMLLEAKRVGVKGAENVTDLGGYVNRVWRPEEIRRLEQKHGKDAIEQLVADSILTPGLRGNRSEARKFIDAVKKLEYAYAGQDLVFNAHDAKTLRHELAQSKLTPSEIETIIATMFEEHSTTADAGNAPNLKFRFQLDESAAINVNGERVTLRDLMENDSRVLVDRYMNHMAGQVALAERGFKSRADFEAALKLADANHEADGSNPKRAGYAKERDMLHDLYANISGRPMSVQSFNQLDRVASTVRGFARSVYLGQLGYTAALELSHAAGMSTWRAAMTQLPAFKQFFMAVRKGQVPAESLANDIRTWLGYSLEHASAYARQAEVTDFTYDRALTKWENLSNRASHFTDRYSGNSFMTSYSRGLAAAFMVQKYANMALGKLKVTDSLKKRMVGAGINEGEIGAVFEHLKEYTVRDETGRVERINWEKWSAEQPDTYAAFTTAVDRDVRTAIQDHDLGETWFLQHTSIGKIFTELRAFSIAAHAKQTASSLHYRDMMSLHLWTTSFITQAVGYMAQTAVNYGHSQKELDKRLAPERVVRAVIARSNMMGVAPTLANGITKPLGFDMSGPGMTANTDNRDLFSTPSTMLIGRTLSTAQAGLGLFAGRPITDRNVLDVPVPNFLGIRNIQQHFSTQFPHQQQH